MMQFCGCAVLRSVATKELRIWLHAAARSECPDQAPLGLVYDPPSQTRLAKARKRSRRGFQVPGREKVTEHDGGERKANLVGSGVRADGLGMLEGS